MLAHIGDNTIMAEVLLAMAILCLNCRCRRVCPRSQHVVLCCLSFATRGLYRVPALARRDLQHGCVCVCVCGCVGFLQLRLHVLVCLF